MNCLHLQRFALLERFPQPSGSGNWKLNFKKVKRNKLERAALFQNLFLCLKQSYQEAHPRKWVTKCQSKKSGILKQVNTPFQNYCQIISVETPLQQSNRHNVRFAPGSKQFLCLFFPSLLSYLLACLFTSVAETGRNWKERTFLFPASQVAVLFLSSQKTTEQRWDKYEVTVGNLAFGKEVEEGGYTTAEKNC